MPARGIPVLQHPYRPPTTATWNLYIFRNENFDPQAGEVRFTLREWTQLGTVNDLINKLVVLGVADKGCTRLFDSKGNVVQDINRVENGARYIAAITDEFLP